MLGGLVDMGEQLLRLLLVVCAAFLRLSHFDEGQLVDCKERGARSRARSSWADH